MERWATHATLRVGSKHLSPKTADEALAALADAISPLSRSTDLHVFQDGRTGAKFCECYISAEKLVMLGTTDTPLDPEEQAEYRANRDLVENAPAYTRMREDAKKKRSFSGLVAEFIPSVENTQPLKIIGGQHRFTAIKEAYEDNVNELHGIKIYFGLTMDQRFDAQIISNTVIAISNDLYDRMHETRSGPELRKWCQEVGLLSENEDFADTRARGNPLTVRAARTFITSYINGTKIDSKLFPTVETTPAISSTGGDDADWQQVKSEASELWSDPGLRMAGVEFARLIAAQRAAFAGAKTKPKVPVDYPEKALNFAVLAAWAYVAGVLKGNHARLKRHYALADTAGKDPLNASALAKGRHKTDAPNYRGLGYRVDAKERGRLAELFFLQAEDGSGIAPAMIDVAIKQFYAKQAALEVAEAKKKVEVSGKV